MKFSWRMIAAAFSYALGVLGWAFVKQDVTVMVATGLVVGVQVMNIIQWVQNHS